VFRLRRKKEKEIYFKNLKKKKETSFRRTTNYIYAHSRSILLSFSRSPNSRAKNTHPTIRTLLSSVLENDLSVVIYSLQHSAIFIRTIYHSLVHSLYSCLPHSRSPSSFYQIYLPILLLCCTFFRQYSNAFTVLRYVHVSWRARGERERDAGPIKKIITRFRGTSSSPNFDAPRSRKQTGDVG